MPESRIKLPAVVLLALAAALTSCSTTDGDGSTVTPVDIPAETMSYIVLAWNDLGMHGFSPTYDQEVLLPPYNTLVAQVIKRGDPPEIVTSGVTLEYRIVNNTYSYGKGSANPLRVYAGFWDNSLDLFGVDLVPDTGLNFVDPGVHNGLTGTMLAKDDRFVANGIPVVPFEDAATEPNPYQVAEIVVRDASTSAVLATTRATVPTSDEINCGKCHGQPISGEVVLSVLAEHDEDQGTTFASDGAPVLCADCHGSPALGQTGKGSSGLYLSQAIHGFHSSVSAACYDCHPGVETKANRSTAHTAADGNCTICHGDLSNISATISSGRVPWDAEPKCMDCHTFVAEVNTGTTLYRDATAHNGISCPACHGSPHAQVPTDKESDNYQALQYQSKAVALGSCRVCHSDSKGGGLIDIVQAHGSDRPTACRVCHTGSITTNNPYGFPHRFQSRKR
jgi:hypothetical protein